MDRRAANHLDPELRAVHWALERWGGWVRDSQPRPWPRRTVLGRLVDEGPGAGHARQDEPEPPPAVVLIERAVCTLGELERRVVREEYTRWAPVEVAARRSRLSVSRYRRVLSRARWRLRGFIDGCSGNESL